MRIVFDNIIYSLQKAGGISVVWTNLILRISQAIKDVVYLEYDGEQNINRQSITLYHNNIIQKRNRFPWIARYCNPSFHCNEPFIFHSSYFRTCNNPHAINITTVHDFTYEYYVNNPIKKWIHCRQKYQAIRKSDYVVCISEHTRKDLLKFLPDVREDKVKVIYNGVGDTFHILDNRRTEDYVLFVGNRDPYKNFDKIIKPVCEARLRLVIIGKPLHNSETQLLNATGCRYEYAGYVSDEELNILYNNAFCLLYPSEYEGFGLPVIEAQKAGCPVIAYNGSSIKEITGDDTLLLQTTSKEEIITKLQLLHIPSLRESVISRGLENARNYSWEKMANEYLSLYKKAIML